MFTFKVFDTEAEIMFDDVIDMTFQTVEELETKIDLHALFAQEVFFIFSTFKAANMAVSAKMNKPGDFTVSISYMNEGGQKFHIIIEPQQTESRVIQKYLK